MRFVLHTQSLKPRFLTAALGASLMVALGCSAAPGDCADTKQCEPGGSEPRDDGHAGSPTLVDGAGSGGYTGEHPASAGGSGWAGGSNPDPRGGAGGAAGAPGVDEPPPPTCVPDTEPDVPDADYADTNCDGIDGDVEAAIFVAPGGDDASNGSIEQPVQSLTRGVELAQVLGKDVYVCNGTYAESLSVEGSGVRFFGGYDCDNGWQRTSTQAHIAPASGTPLVLRDIDGVVTLDQMAFTAPDAVAVGESSIAVFAVNVAALDVVRSTLTAGNGAPGENGKSVQAVNTAARQGQRGHSVALVECTNLNQSTYCHRKAPGGSSSTADECPQGGTVRGGSGGWGANCIESGGDCSVATSGQAGQKGLPSGPTNGGSGASGSKGASGSAAAGGFGSVDDSGYQPSNVGTKGKNGKPGQSGGGGRGGISGRYGSADVEYKIQIGGGGGQGGYGGCGGWGGNPGKGGGASIGLLLVHTGASLTDSVINTGDGGPGGNPSDGASGQPGGAGGVPGNSNYGNPAQPGGKGGKGGKGGAGAPGGGGPSIAVVAKGIEPVMTATTYTLGNGGKGGTAVAGSGSANGADGLTGGVHLMDVPAPAN